MVIKMNLKYKNLKRNQNCMIHEIPIKIEEISNEKKKRKESKM